MSPPRGRYTQAQFKRDLECVAAKFGISPQKAAKLIESAVFKQRTV
jgi:hypothetical protein